MVIIVSRPPTDPHVSIGTHDGGYRCVCMCVSVCLHENFLHGFIAQAGNMTTCIDHCVKYVT